MGESNYADRIKDLVEETVDKFNELLEEFGERAGDIVKDAADSEKVDQIVDKVLELRNNLSGSAGDLIKSVTSAIVGAGESITSLIKKDSEDDD